MIAATDYMRSFADQIRPWVDAPYRVLGTDGYGRSDYRKTLRSFFEVDRHHVVLAALTELAQGRRGGRGRAEAGDRVLRHRHRTARPMAGVREAGVAGTEQVLVPDIGDFEDVPVIEVLVSVGDEVAAEDPLVVLESDKATMEVPSPAAGKVAKIEVSVGDKVKEGTRDPVARGERRERRRAGAAADGRGVRPGRGVEGCRGRRGVRAAADRGDAGPRFTAGPADRGAGLRVARACAGWRASSAST